MSLSRSRMSRHAEVDPYALSDPEEDKKAEARKTRRRVVPKKAPAAPGAQLPRLRSGADAVDAVESTELLTFVEEENTTHNVLRVNTPELDVDLTGQNALFTRKSEVTKQRIREDWGLAKTLTHKPLVRYVSFGESPFEATPQAESCCLLQKTSSTRPLQGGKNVTVTTVSPIETVYSMRPYIEDHLDVEDALKALSNRHRNTRAPANVTTALVKNRLTKEELKELKHYCKRNKQDEITADEFVEAWSAAKNSSISRKYYAEEELIAPEKTLVASLYGASSASVAIPLNEIVLKLYQLSLIEGTFFAPTSLDELDERTYRAQDRDERVEEGFTEDIEGAERVFDDDIDDAPEQHPDHAAMDHETLAWATNDAIGLHGAAFNDVEAEDADDDGEEEGAAGAGAGAGSGVVANEAKSAKKTAKQTAKRSVSATAATSAAKRRK